MTIQLIHDDFCAALADVRRIAADLHERRGTVARTVDVLLDGGWSGAAATAYGAGWDEWRAGCREVLLALDALGDLLEDARATLTREDDAVAEVFAS